MPNTIHGKPTQLDEIGKGEVLFDKQDNEQALQQLAKEKFQRKLQTAMEYAINCCIFGSGNKIKDLRKNKGWSLRQDYRYHVPGKYLKLSDGLFSPYIDDMPNIQFDTSNKFHYDIKQWYYHPDHLDKIYTAQLKFEPINEYVDPLSDPQFHLSPDHKSLLEYSLVTMAKREGNCGARTELVAHYFWRHPEGINRIEAIDMATFDHVIIVINRSGNLKDPTTWGDAWIVDAWYGRKGLIFHANDFKENMARIKKFAKIQADALKKINMCTESYPDNANDIGDCVFEINPQRDLYPSYAPHLSVEDYYIVTNAYPAPPNEDDSICTIIEENMKQHKANFHTSLQAINKLKRESNSSNMENKSEEPSLNSTSTLDQTKKVLYSAYEEFFNAPSRKGSFQREFKDKLEEKLFTLVRKRYPVKVLATNKYFILFQKIIKDYPDLLNATNERMQTPLIVASINRNTFLVKSLLQVSGSNIDAIDKQKNTALSWAAYYGYPEVVAELLKHNPCITSKNIEERTAEQEALIRGNADVVNLFLDYRKAPREERQKINFLLAKREKNAISNQSVFFGQKPSRKRDFGSSCVKLTVTP